MMKLNLFATKLEENHTYIMKNIVKRIAAMGAAVMIMASMSAIGASAYQASYEDSYRIILAYTSYTPSETDSVGTVTNLSTTKTNYSVQSTLYYKTSAAKIGSYTPSGWKNGTLSKGQLLKATTTHNRNTSYKYSARTLELKLLRQACFVAADEKLRLHRALLRIKYALKKF